MNELELSMKLKNAIKCCDTADEASGVMVSFNEHVKTARQMENTLFVLMKDDSLFFCDEEAEIMGVVPKEEAAYGRVISLIQQDILMEKAMESLKKHGLAK